MSPEIPAYVFGLLFGVSAAVTYLLTWLLVRFAARFGALDRPDERKVHRVPVPRLGGLAIFIAVAVALAFGCVISQRIRGTLLPADMWLALKSLFSSSALAALGAQPTALKSFGIFIGLVVMFGLGMYDDTRHASWIWKFAFQMVAAAIVIHYGVVVQKVTNPFGGAPFELGNLAVYWTFIWLIGITNAVNLSDGLDGLASGIVMIIAGVTFVITLNLMQTRPEQYDMFVLAAIVSIILLGATLAFLKFNFYPARIFLGDSGSLFLGFLIACTAVVSSQISSTTVALVVPIIALGLPILDTVLAILRRTAKRRNPFQADKEHIHHKMLESGLSHPEAVLVLYGFCVLLGGAALVLAFKMNQYAGLVLFVLTAVTLVGFKRFGILDVSRLWGFGKPKEKNGGVREQPAKERAKRS